MSTINMKEETLINLTSEITEAIEEIIKQKSCYTKLDCLLEEKVHYSLSHIRDVFGITTGIGLNKYITRRIYTHILKSMDEEIFCNIKQKEKICNIPNFKIKCMNEFPFLCNDFNTKKMQQYINKEDISLLVKEQLKTKNINSMINSIFKEITEGREIINLTSLGSKILIQDNYNIIIDIEKSAFKVNDIIFNICATENVKSDNKDEFFSLLFSKDVYPMDSYFTDANIAITKLAQFYSKKCELNCSISIVTQWGGNNWGSANLISHIDGDNKSISNIELLDNTFLSFDKGKVFLDTNFYIDRFKNK
ncbi:hypothetical protein [Clostridioides sp. ES-S-0001-02]|uniref:hypothetical protein n=1 Tax=Clostridioides sp. ES-S-0001-02 TaxID=2770770 RepID=UPI001D12C820|nr:hypothetical protein [Clostridioides sp. ES-S-0001-02]